MKWRFCKGFTEKARGDDGGIMFGSREKTREHYRKIYQKDEDENRSKWCRVDLKVFSIQNSVFSLVH